MTINEINNIKAEINNTGAVINIPILNIPFMSEEQWREHVRQHNQRIADDIMAEWNCTEIEAWAAMEYDTTTLEDTQKTIATAVTHDRLLISLYPGNLAYLRNEHYKVQDVSEEFLQSEAKEMTEEQAWQFTYDWEQLDNYDEMSESEKEAVLFGTGGKVVN